MNRQSDHPCRSAAAGHGHHGHRHAAETSERRLLWAMALTGGFLLAEVAGGVLAGSLALLADAAHMLTDLGALVLAHAGIRLGRRPADLKRSFGYRRLEVLAAFANGVILMVLTLWIVFEAAQRLYEPVPVLGGWMLAVALMGLAANLGAFALLRGEARESIGIAGAMAHIVGDLLGSFAAILAAGVILATDWTPIDPILSLAVSALILRSGWGLLSRSGHILLEGTPEDVDLGEVAHAASRIGGVLAAHHVHVWSLTSGRRLATLHLKLEDGAAPAEALAAVRAMLQARFAIEHSTIELDIGAADRPGCAEEGPGAPPESRRRSPSSTRRGGDGPSR